MKYDFLSKYYYKGPEIYTAEYNRRKNSLGCAEFDFQIDGNPVFIIPTMDVVSLISNIYKKNSDLLLKLQQLPDIARDSYETSCLIDEIMMTNDIEGVHSTRREIKEVIASPPEDKSRRFAGLVMKYMLLLKEPPEIDLKTCAGIRQLYDDIVLNEVIAASRENEPDGELFRKDAAEVVSGTQKVKHVGLYPETKVIEAMNQALSILNSTEVPLLIRTAIFHYLFGYIHPFYDSNGRTSRFISSYILSQELCPLVAYRLSCAVKERKSDYYKAFDACNDVKNKGDLTPFVFMFLEMIYNAVDNLESKVNEGFEKLTFYDNLLASALPNSKDKVNRSLLYSLIQNSLFSSDTLGLAQLQSILGCSKPTVKSAIDALIDDSAPILIGTESRNRKVYAPDMDKIGDYLEAKAHSQ